MRERRNGSAPTSIGVKYRQVGRQALFVSEALQGYGDLRQRTKAFALSIVRLYSSLPTGLVAQTIGKQFLRSGTSIGAHYREACRARSDAEFICKIELLLQELDETMYWLELLADAGVSSSDQVANIVREANELMSIFVTAVKTVKGRIRK